MKEKPILLNAEMVRAVLDGRKTQARKIIQERHLYRGRGPGNWPAHMPTGSEGDQAIQWLTENCAFGSVGDRAWVRETFAYGADFGETDVGCFYRATDPGWDDNDTGARWRPSTHMPRSASRITLEITGVRVERLNSINEHDAIAEGLAEISKDGRTYKYGIPDRDGYPGTDDFGWPWHEWERYPISAYSKLWKSIYGADSWQANPWVWVIEFKRVEE